MGTLPAILFEENPPDAGVLADKDFDELFVLGPVKPLNKQSCRWLEVS